MKYVLMNAHRESWQQQLICSHVCCILNLRRTLNTNDYMVMETTPNSCDMRQAIICCWHGYICVRQNGTQLLTQVSFLIYSISSRLPILHIVNDVHLKRTFVYDIINIVHIQKCHPSMFTSKFRRTCGEFVWISMLIKYRSLYLGYDRYNRKTQIYETLLHFLQLTII